MQIFEHGAAANDTQYLPARHRTLPISESVTPIANYPTKLRIFKTLASRYWQVRCYLRGKTYTQSLKTTNKSAAISQAKQFFHIKTAELYGEHVVVREDRPVIFNDLVVATLAQQQARVERGELTALSLAILRSRLSKNIQPCFGAMPAKYCCEDMRKDLAAGVGKKVYTAYIAVIETYFIPFFGQHYLTSITHKHIAEFEVWRNTQLKRKPKSSTLLTFASAFSRICSTAVEQGWISANAKLPKLSVKGEQASVRAAFTDSEVQRIREHLTTWYEHVKGDTSEMRRLLRDLVDVLIFTGMRQGTESMNLQWKHIAWHMDSGVRYLRIWVKGKQVNAG